MKDPHDADFELRTESTASSTLQWLRLQTTEYLIETLVEPLPGLQLEWDERGIVLEGNHRIQVLRERGVDVNRLAVQVWNSKEGG